MVARGGSCAPEAAFDLARSMVMWSACRGGSATGPGRRAAAASSSGGAAEATGRRRERRRGRRSGRPGAPRGRGRRSSSNRSHVPGDRRRKLETAPGSPRAGGMRGAGHPLPKGSIRSRPARERGGAGQPAPRRRGTAISSGIEQRLRVPPPRRGGRGRARRPIRSWAACWSTSSRPAEAANEVGGQKLPEERGPPASGPRDGAEREVPPMAGGREAGAPGALDSRPSRGPGVDTTGAFARIGRPGRPHGSDGLADRRRRPRPGRF